MKFHRNYVNKLITFADRYFTWDIRHLKREGTSVELDFFAIRKEETDYTSVSISLTKYGIHAYIKQNNETYSRILKSYKEVNAFKEKVKLLG